MSTPEEVPSKGANVSTSTQIFKDCWSCRVLAGGGLTLSGAYVYLAARKVMQRGAPTTVGTVTQISFAACLFAWGVVVLFDPVGRTRKS